ncbi:MAG: acyl-CoA dehydratase activase-related protein [Clostridia bacterium]|nr:acyl-CoA dehydratase activase-related protein [Clostridia bacterium]
MKKKLTIGLPRAMLYYRYSTLWQSFFESLGAEVIKSNPTDKKILDEGTALCVDEACLSEKIFLGHVKALVERCDYILVPRVSSFGHKRMMCARFEAMPDIVCNVFRNEPQKFLTYNLDVILNQDEKKAFLEMGQQLGFGKKEVKKAYAAAKTAEQRQWKQQVAEQEALYKTDGIKILVAAHSYVIEDPYLGKPVLDILRELGVTPIRADIVEREPAVKRSTSVSPTIKWEMSREIVGSLAVHKDKVAGVILLSAFPCGPDSMVNEIIQRRIKGVPMLNLTLDAQSGTAGVETRLESFVDIIHFKEGTL